MSDDMAKGCNNCPARSKCEGLTYRGSACTALRYRYGAPEDPEIRSGADDLISRKALLDEFDRVCVKRVMAHGASVNLEIDFVRAVQQASAVDPHEHGRWRTTNAYPHHLYCSACHKTYLANAEWLNTLDIPTEYCPNCGAKMDLEG